MGLFLPLISINQHLGLIRWNYMDPWVQLVNIKEVTRQINNGALSVKLKYGYIRKDALKIK